MASGAILTRSGWCATYDHEGDDLHTRQLLEAKTCPLCPVLPVVQERVGVGGLIFPPFQPPNLVRRLGLRGARLNWAAAGKLGTHSIGRGAARA